MTDSAGSAGRELVREVLRVARRDTEVLPAEAARLTVARLGPHVAAAAEADAAQPQRWGREAVTARTCRAVAAEGAFVGGPVLVLVPVAFCAALLRQLRGVLELAAAAGRDPADPERAVELLLLQGAYEEADAARAAVAEASQAGGGASADAGGRRGLAGWWLLGMRAAHLLGLLTSGQAPSRWRQLGGWVVTGLVFVVGIVAPLVWLPYLAWSYDRATRRLMSRAADYYLGVAGPPPGPAGGGGGPARVRWDPALVGALVRGAASLLVAVAFVALTVLADLRVLGSRWPVLALLLAVSSAATGLLWLRHRRRRGRRRRDKGRGRT